MLLFVLGRSQYNYNLVVILSSHAFSLFLFQHLRDLIGKWIRGFEFLTKTLLCCRFINLFLFKWDSSLLVINLCHSPNDFFFFFCPSSRTNAHFHIFVEFGHLISLLHPYCFCFFFPFVHTEMWHLFNLPTLVRTVWYFFFHSLITFQAKKCLTPNNNGKYKVRSSFLGHRKPGFTPTELKANRDPQSKQQLWQLRQPIKAR